MPRILGRQNRVSTMVSDAELHHYEKAVHYEGFQSLSEWMRRILNQQAINTLTLHSDPNIYITPYSYKSLPKTGRPRKYQVSMKQDGSSLLEDKLRKRDLIAHDLDYPKDKKR